MAANYWLKMYHESLHDPKLAALPNNIWRRFWECCLMAGESNEGGFLPSLTAMAWTVRVSEETLRAEMGQLAQSGFVELKLDGSQEERWFVSNFAKRQAASSGAKRVQEYRKRLKEEEKKKEIEIETDNIYIPYMNSNVTHVTKSYIEPDTEAIAEIKTAISQASKTPLWSKTEEEYVQAAHLLKDQGATPEKVFGFLAWWKINGSYTGKPALKSLLGEWTNYVDGVTVAGNGHQNGQHKILYQPDENGVY